MRSGWHDERAEALFRGAIGLLPSCSSVQITTVGWMTQPSM